MQRIRGRFVRTLATTEAAVTVLQPRFSNARSERLCVVHLHASLRPIGLFEQHAAEGEPVDFPIRTIVRAALMLGTAQLILAHNHPSGDPAPTTTDRDATRTLAQVGRPLGLIVRDHLIFGGDSWVSFRERGLL